MSLGLLRLALAALLCLVAVAVRANGWASFYGGAAPAAGSARAPTLSAEHGICLREILEAQERHDIPGNILLGIGLQEAGLMKAGELTVWPYAVNSEGSGYHFETRRAALDFVAAEQRRGVESMDVGCMQINLRWHPGAFATIEDGFTPRLNVDYAARFLKRLHSETGDWQRAASAYHSRTPDKQAIYHSALMRNIRVANQRINGFRALADLPAETAPAGRGPGGPIWSTAAIAGAARHTLYGGGALQPVLPQLKRGD
ncbi:transglycosylase SLT domain-containing protein [Roseivivax sp. CAU 1761]